MFCCSSKPNLACCCRAVDGKGVVTTNQPNGKPVVTPTSTDNGGVPMEHIMALGGWKSAAMAKRYARINPVELHDQIRTLEELPSYDDPAA